MISSEFHTIVTPLDNFTIYFCNIGDEHRCIVKAPPCTLDSWWLEWSIIDSDQNITNGRITRHTTESGSYPEFSFITKRNVYYTIVGTTFGFEKKTVLKCVVVMLVPTSNTSNMSNTSNTSNMSNMSNMSNTSNTSNTSNMSNMSNTTKSADDYIPLESGDIRQATEQLDNEGWWIERWSQLNEYGYDPCEQWNRPKHPPSE